MNATNPLSHCTLEAYETTFAARHRLMDVVDDWAARKPEAAALIDAATGSALTWREFARESEALACALAQRGLRRGDRVTTMLPMTTEHVVFEYACFRLGAIVAPLDLRLSAAELERALQMIKPSIHAALSGPAPFDYTEHWRAVREQKSVAHCLALGGAVEGAESFAAWMASARASQPTASDRDAMRAQQAAVAETDGALVIFTTGSTGSPKPALLTHRSITAQCMCLSAAFFGGDSGRRVLVNLPPSHVGGQSEVLMGSLFGGGEAVLLAAFDAARSLRAIAERRVEIIGQIPAMYNLEWMNKEYPAVDLSSLGCAVHGGNAVSTAFAERLATMAPEVGTGLGLTEASGFCTYIRASAAKHERVATSLGWAAPIYPCAIRKAMREDGLAGEECAEGEVGCVCFSGPQNFAGYMNDEEATRRTISRDGWLYTGDLGAMVAGELRLAGREKWVIKTLGHQVYPGDIEACVQKLADKVANCVAIGVEHAVAGEAVVAVVEKRAGAELTTSELTRQARELATYMRPRHWIVLEAGALPLNRVAKPDHARVAEMARRAVEELRRQGRWERVRG